MSPLDLGPFSLMERFASGGMGTVWLAHHRAQDVPVAIKILGGQHADDSGAVARFHDEVRAVAGLDHPGVVHVLDHGEVPESTAMGSRGQLVPGAPWLAMELATGGTLEPLGGALDWRGLKQVLLAVLDALAHAHARGVIHRDLKPSNILLATQEDLRPGLKLTDFGIAHAVGRHAHAGRYEDHVAGTPKYMSPEQVRGEWRDYGPWTDLYALGIVAYWLASGQHPYPGRRGSALLVAHMQHAAAPLEPTCAVPEGFEAWLATLMAKEPVGRFQRAADAAAALEQLGEPTGPEPERDPVDEETERVLEATRVSLGETWRLVLDGVPKASPRPRPQGPIPPSAPFSPTYRRPLPAPAAPQLLGAGMRLWGLRSIPLVGREPERDRLWRALADVAETGRARVVLVRGPAGTGKSRLVEWICRRAHELGSATWAKATFNAKAAPGEALQRFGNDYLGTGGLSRSEVRERIARFLEARGGTEEDVATITELLHPLGLDTPEAGERIVRLTRPYEYYAGTRTAMAHVAAERPLICWMDDVQWGAHGLGLARLILRTQGELPFPCLLLLTLRDEALADRPEETEGLRRLMEMDRTEELPLGPLPRRDHATLVRELLRLDERLARQVEEKTEGNPLFAVQLVGSWVQRDLLEVGTTGLRLRPSADTELPADLAAVWEDALKEVLAEFRPEARHYLEKAALLGQEVDREEWDQACDDPEGHFGARFPGDRALRARLVERLLHKRLAVGTRDRWSFVHGMLREALARSARDSGRAATHHAACASMLWARASSPIHAPAERLGRHLLEAGLVEMAIAPLLGGAERRRITQGPSAALALLETLESAMREAGLPAKDKRWGRVWTNQARALLDAGQGERAAVLARQALAESDAHGWGGAKRHALHVLGLAHLATGRDDDADKAFTALRHAALAARSAHHLGHALRGLASVSRRRGAPEAARALLEQSEAAFVQAELPGEQAAAMRDRGRLLVELDRLDEAGAALEGALRIVADEGLAPSIAETRRHLAGLARRRGDLPSAETHLRAVLADRDAAEQHTVRIELARVLVDQGRAAEVVDVLAPLRARTTALGHSERVRLALGLELVDAAVRRDLTTYARLARRLDASDDTAAELVRLAEAITRAEAP